MSRYGTGGRRGGRAEVLGEYPAIHAFSNVNVNSWRWALP